MSNISALDRPDATTAVPPLPHEADRRRRLTVMRRWATGTLAAVSLLWLAVVLVQPSGDWVPYVLAALEASMVGALADWFAVVALFRRPLGLPIPHTAIVVAGKEQFGRTLAAFFRENFLSGPAVRERMRSSGAVVRAVDMAGRSGTRAHLGPERPRARRRCARHDRRWSHRLRGSGDARGRRGGAGRTDERGPGSCRKLEPDARRRRRRRERLGAARPPGPPARPRSDLHRRETLVAARSRATPTVRKPGEPGGRHAERDRA